MLSVCVILHLPATARPIYAMLGQPLKIAGEGFVMLRGDQLVHDAHYVRVRLSHPQDKKGIWVWVPSPFVVVVVSGARDQKIGFGNA